MRLGRSVSSATYWVTCRLTTKSFGCIDFDSSIFALNQFCTVAPSAAVLTCVTTTVPRTNRGRGWGEVFAVQRILANCYRACWQCASRRPCNVVVRPAYCRTYALSGESSARSAASAAGGAYSISNCVLKRRPPSLSRTWAQRSSRSDFDSGRARSQLGRMSATSQISSRVLYSMTSPNSHW